VTRPTDYAFANAPTAFVSQGVQGPELKLAYGQQQLRDLYALQLVAVVASAEFEENAGAPGPEAAARTADVVWDLVDALLAERHRRDPPPPDADVNGRKLRLT